MGRLLPLPARSCVSLVKKRGFGRGLVAKQDTDQAIGFAGGPVGDSSGLEQDRSFSFPVL